MDVKLQKEGFQIRSISDILNPIFEVCIIFLKK